MYYQITSTECRDGSQYETELKPIETKGSWMTGGYCFTTLEHA